MPRNTVLTRDTKQSRTGLYWVFHSVVVVSILFQRRNLLAAAFITCCCSNALLLVAAGNGVGRIDDKYPRFVCCCSGGNGLSIDVEMSAGKSAPN
jgi:hypothetical protein